MLYGGKMKKTPFLCLVFIIISLVFAGASEQKSAFSLKAAGGFGRPFPGDLDAVLDSYNSLFEDMAGRLGLSREGGLEKPAGMTDFRAELTWQFSKKVGIGLAIGRLHNQKSDRMVLLMDPLYETTLQFSRRVLAVPVEMTLTYRFLRTSRWGVYGLGGIHYCFVTFSYSMKLDENIWEYTTWSRSEGKVKDSSLGVHGGVGVSFDLSRGLGLFLEITGRNAVLNRWEGEESYSDFEKSSEKRLGSLWRVDYSDENAGRTYSTLRLAEKKPEGPGFKNVGLFKNNLSGAFLRLGLSISF